MTWKADGKQCKLKVGRKRKGGTNYAILLKCDEDHISSNTFHDTEEAMQIIQSLKYERKALFSTPTGHRNNVYSIQ